MTAHSYKHGHKIIFDPLNYKWLYADTGTPTKNINRPCKHCGKVCENGIDACLGNLEGVESACCGHGNSDKSFIKFNNGITVRGFTIEKKKCSECGGTKKITVPSKDPAIQANFGVDEIPCPSCKGEE